MSTDRPHARTNDTFDAWTSRTLGDIADNLVPPSEVEEALRQVKQSARRAETDERDRAKRYREQVAEQEFQESLKPLLGVLPRREKKILELLFFRKMTPAQVAQELGISQVHVSRLSARALARLGDEALVEE